MEIGIPRGGGSANRCIFGSNKCGGIVVAADTGDRRLVVIRFPDRIVSVIFVVIDRRCPHLQVTFAVVNGRTPAIATRDGVIVTCGGAAGGGGAAEPSDITRHGH